MLWQILLLYAALVAVDLFHMFCQYTIVPRLGSVSVGIGKSISSITVFILSHFLFCGYQASQCIDVWKSISLGVVVAGVLIYTVGVVRRVKKSENSGKSKLDEYTDMSESNEFTYDEHKRHNMSRKYRSVADEEDETFVDHEISGKSIEKDLYS